MPIASPGRTPRGQFICTVAGNEPICREHFRLVLRVDSDFPATEPGQFIQIFCREPDWLDRADEVEAFEQSCGEHPAAPQGFDHDPDLARRVALLRRPFSLAGRRDLPGGGAELLIIHRVVGVGTQWLAELRAGQTVSIIGPLGNQFALPAVTDRQPDGRSGGGAPTAILVGGGVGIPPMLYLAQRLAREHRRAIAFCGAVTKDLLPLTITDDAGIDPSEPAPIVGEFARLGIRSVVSTDDGSCGYRGYVTQALETFLDRAARADPPGGDCARADLVRADPNRADPHRADPHRANPSRADPHRANPNRVDPHRADRFVLYTCGPELMMKRVADIAAARDLDVQIAVERAMACGMGTCQSCCIRVRSGAKTGGEWRYALACTDGPVFHGTELLW